MGNSKEAKYIKEVQCISNKSIGKRDIKVSSKISTSFDECIHSCPHCARTFPRGSQLVLNEHIKQCHSLYPFHCQDCRKKLPTMSIFAAHKRGHKLMHPFKCGKCGHKLGQEGGVVVEVVIGVDLEVAGVDLGEEVE